MVETAVPDLEMEVETDLVEAAMAGEAAMAAAVDLEALVVLVAKKNSLVARTCVAQTGVQCPYNHSTKISITHTHQWWVALPMM